MGSLRALADLVCKLFVYTVAAVCWVIFMISLAAILGGCLPESDPRFDAALEHYSQRVATDVTHARVHVTEDSYLELSAWTWPGAAIYLRAGHPDFEVEGFLPWAVAHELCHVVAEVQTGDIDREHEHWCYPGRNHPVVQSLAEFLPPEL